MAHLSGSNADLIARVRRIAGQVGAVERGLTSGDSCATVLHLVAAVRGAVNGLMDEIIAEHLEAHVARSGLTDEERAHGADELLAVRASSELLEELRKDRSAAEASLAGHLESTRQLDIESAEIAVRLEALIEGIRRELEEAAKVLGERVRTGDASAADSFELGVILLRKKLYTSALKSLDAGTLLIDIGTVMAPSVALGVTVDDVVHFMLWFRKGIADGLDRKQATMLAYKGCARAMYQSWGVIGIGLSVFALSPFGPTQRFGHMMLSMLTIALVGNLVFMPALLAGPLGAVFSWSVLRIERNKARREGRRKLKTDPGTDALPAPHVVPGPAKQVVHA